MLHLIQRWKRLPLSVMKIPDSYGLGLGALIPTPRSL
jgi:hypothetical protein